MHLQIELAESSGQIRSSYNTSKIVNTDNDNDTSEKCNNVRSQ